MPRKKAPVPPPAATYRVSQKVRPQSRDYNSVKSQPIFKIGVHSPHIVVYRIEHEIKTSVLEYLAKVQARTWLSRALLRAWPPRC